MGKEVDSEKYERKRKRRKINGRRKMWERMQDFVSMTLRNGMGRHVG